MKRTMSEHPEVEDRWTGYEVGDGDYVVCERGNAAAWIRSDTVLELADGARTRTEHEDRTRTSE